MIGYDAAPDMEYAHPGAPARCAPPASCDLRTVDQRRQDEIGHARPCGIAALTRQMSQISQLTITLAADVRRLGEAAADHATRIAELRARLDGQEATD